MTAPLHPELAAAYVRELSAAVTAVVVLTEDGALLAGPDRLHGPATALAEALESGSVRVQTGVVWVARHAGATLIAVAGPEAQTGPTGLDVAAAIGSSTPVTPIVNPLPELKTAVENVIRET